MEVKWKKINKSEIIFKNNNYNQIITKIKL